MFVRQVGHWLENHDVKLVVIACNTATAAGLDVLQRTMRVPVIGVIEPGARAAIQATHTRRVGVLAKTGRSARTPMRGLSTTSMPASRFYPSCRRQFC